MKEWTKIKWWDVVKYKPLGRREVAGPEDDKTEDRIWEEEEVLNIAFLVTFGVY